MEKEYYNKYWRYEYKDKFGYKPPARTGKELKRILDFSSLYIKGRVLDVGCGGGVFTYEISKLPQAKDAKGVDISPLAIKSALQRYPDLEFFISSANRLPFKDNSFDTITAIEIVEHILDIEMLFSELNRVTKTDGHIIIATTDFNLLKKILISMFCFDKYFYPVNPHIRFFTKKNLEKILRQFGFTPLKHRWNGDYCFIMPKGQIMIARKVKHL